MTFATGDIIDSFGAVDDVINATGSTSAVTDTSLSVAGDLTAWTNDEDSKKAAVTIKWQYPSGTIDAGASINLYCRKMNVQSTNDESTIDASNKKHFLGSAQVDEGLATATDDYITFDIDLENWITSSVYEFFWENNTGVSISAGWAAWINTKTTNQKA